MAEQLVVRHAGEGEALWMLGGLYEVKASGEETGGVATIMEITLPAGMGPPLHTHPGGEAVYVLEGKLKYHVGDQEFEGRPGSFFYIPTGTLEAFEPVEDSRILVWYTPGGMDRFFAEAGEPAARREVPAPPDGPPDMEQLVEIAGRHGMDIPLPVE